VVEAFATAVQRWPADGVPPNPGAWLTTAANRKAIDRIRRDTDWSQAVALYDQLVRLDPSPIIALNRAIAVAELDGPKVALAAINRLGTNWPAITPTMRPAPTCCAGWAAVRSRARRTTKPSSRRATPARPPT
jgi:predicted RNA polymerase sigma factor